MAGGVHADHSHVEAWLGTSFSAAGKPFTDAHVDAMCIAAEAAIQARLPQGVNLPTTASTEWRQVVVQLVVNLMERADKWQRSRGATTESGEATGSATFAEYGASPFTQSIIDQINHLIAREASLTGASYGDTVSDY